MSQQFPQTSASTTATPGNQMSGGRPRRVAVVLFNLGGPDAPEAVRPFLFNLFADPAIIRLPNPFRFLIASLISGRRAKPATAIYAQLGGKSPLLENTEAQAAALEGILGADPATAGAETKVFIAMRYWHPMSAETAARVKAYDPDLVVLLPLYPQFSTTTTASSAKAWHEAARTVGLTAPTKLLCCYPTQAGFIDATADLIRPLYEAAKAHGRPRVLFSAHGLPKKVVTAGDPYQWQCERTAESIAAALGIDDLDWINCYQSRVGPMEWIGPSTDAEIRRAGQDGVPILVVPMAFVSEHSETLVEIEVEYRHLARQAGVPHFTRVPTVGVHPGFIDGLARLVRQTVAGRAAICSQKGDRICPSNFSGCPQARP
ncbi:ferrochelatase [Azospirillum lipoferum]|uniref:Ferrochelatase n=1 Tax=Azospirillum lipoferum TaxID=193 RepID=A0A5A9GW01_AZOLI|nr:MULTISPECIES: ferrochelatase [Azospirillum]KAA0597619.1 ferrochelatase [Azospirillum lipoferum]MCP1610261.1 ferrochelatase [Azospirillum lipoferum]MDW5534246.1 ferrochelatase [Azospirillum sp. NL1]